MSSKIVVKGYKIHREVDQAGFRTIYSALHLKTGKDVFMTVIPIRPGRDFKALTRRAEMSKKLKLPALVTALECGTLHDNSFFYTHYSVPSLPLKRVLEETADPTENLFSSIGYFIDALDIVAYIHDANVTHRDLSTANIRVTAKEQVILEGFINARPKQEPRNIANIVYLPYMAPEQLMGAPADKKTEIYAMGAVLFELITGQLPYPSNYSKIEEARKGITPTCSNVREGIPVELENIIMKALSPRKSRYVHVREWVNDLEEFYDKRSFKMKFREFSSSFKNMFALKS